MHTSGTVHAEPTSTQDSPKYRVNFWRQIAGGAWSLDAFVLVGVHDVTEAMDWVEEHRDGRRFELFVEVGEEPVGSFESPRRSALIRLHGANPNRSEPVATWRFTRSLFPDPAYPLPEATARRSATFKDSPEQHAVRHARGYEAFIALIGEESAWRISADETLAIMANHAQAVLGSPALQRSAAIFLGNKVAAEVPRATWRVYGESGLELSTESASFDVAGAVRAACEGGGDPRAGLRWFLDAERSGEPTE